MRVPTLLRNLPPLAVRNAVATGSAAVPLYSFAADIVVVPAARTVVVFSAASLLRACFRSDHENIDTIA